MSEFLTAALISLAYLPLCLVRLDRLTLKLKTLRSFEMSGTVYPKTKYRIKEDLNSQHKNNLSTEM
jgi:hypothetical protein